MTAETAAPLARHRGSLPGAVAIVTEELPLIPRALEVEGWG